MSKSESTHYLLEKANFTSEDEVRALTFRESAVRDSYLEARPKDIERRAALLATMGVKNVVISPDGTEIEGLELTPANYHAFHQLMEVLSVMAAQNKAEWHKLDKKSSDTVETSNTTLYSRLEAVLHGDNQLGFRGLPLFKTLFSKAIVVSPAHGQTSPGGHTMKVFEGVQVDHFNTILGKMLCMLTALLHDTGKAADLENGGIANGDYLHDHAHLSGYILKELIRNYLVTSQFQMNEQDATNVATAASSIVTYHHLFEVAENGIISLDELLDIVENSLGKINFEASPLLPYQMEEEWKKGGAVSAGEILTYLSPVKIIEHIATLTLADRQSVNLNSVFVLTGLKLLRQMINESTMPAHAIPQFEEVIEQSLRSAWEALHLLIGGNQAANPEVWKLLGRVASDFEQDPTFKDETWQHIWLPWLSRAEPPEHIKRSLLGA